MRMCHVCIVRVLHIVGLLDTELQVFLVIHKIELFDDSLLHLIFSNIWEHQIGVSLHNFGVNWLITLVRCKIRFPGELLHFYCITVTLV